jgi:hypothetical protein
VNRHAGSCHCGNVTVVFETAVRPAEVAVRECQCSFCRKHGSRSVTDPSGALTVAARDWSEVSRYRFGLKTADFLVCRRCGVYAAAVMPDGSKTYGALNLNLLDERAQFTEPPAAVSYDAETVDQRIERRRVRWTPTSVRP